MFVRVISGMQLTDDYVLDCVMEGLKEEIQWMVKIFKPKTVQNVYCLAKLQQLILRAQNPKPPSKVDKIEVVGEN